MRLGTAAQMARWYVPYAPHEALLGTSVITDAPSAAVQTHARTRSPS